MDSDTYQDALALIRKTTRDDGIDALLRDHDVQVLMGPSGPVSPRADVVNGDVWPAWAGAGSMAAISGYPNLTVPMGTIAGVPVGVSFMSGRDADACCCQLGWRLRIRALDRQCLSTSLRLMRRICGRYKRPCSSTINLRQVR